MPACDNCGSSALVQWRRRLTAEEIAASPTNHAPADADSVYAVYACGSHAISGELGALIHQAVCSGPLSVSLPNCDCTPEPLSVEAEFELMPVLPDGW